MPEEATLTHCFDCRELGLPAVAALNRNDPAYLPRYDSRLAGLRFVLASIRISREP